MDASWRSIHPKHIDQHSSHAKTPMNDAPTSTIPPQSGRTTGMALVRVWLGSLARWQKISLAAASLLLVLGLLALLIEAPAPPAGTPESQSTQGTGGIDNPSQLVQGEGQTGNSGTGEAGQEPAPTPWSAGFFRLGFSFFAGLSIGMALRAFLKLALIASGIALLFLFLLAYAELVTVNWAAIDSMFEDFGRRISEESGRFRDFITGSLPSTGLAILGLTTALRGGRR